MPDYGGHPPRDWTLAPRVNKKLWDDLAGAQTGPLPGRSGLPPGKLVRLTGTRKARGRLLKPKLILTLINRLKGRQYERHDKHQRGCFEWHPEPYR